MVITVFKYRGGGYRRVFEEIISNNIIIVVTYALLSLLSLTSQNGPVGMYKL